MGALPAKQNQYVEYAEKDAKMRPIAENIDKLLESTADTQEMIAPEFRATTGYDVGRMVLYEGKLYRCVRSHYGAWAATDFEETNVDYGVSINRYGIGNLSGNIAETFSTASTYAVGAYVMYNNLLWVCTTAVETAGEWNAANWTRVTRKLVNPLMEDIVDSDGHKRFQEWALDTISTVTGLTFSYAKVSLSGTHLMLVIAGSAVSGTEIPDNSYLCEVELPSWIMDKIYPVWNTWIEQKYASFISSAWGVQNLSTVFGKISGKLVIRTTGGAFTLSDDRSFRLQFDLLID